MQTSQFLTQYGEQIIQGLLTTKQIAIATTNTYSGTITVVTTEEPSPEEVLTILIDLIIQISNHDLTDYSMRVQRQTGPEEDQNTITFTLYSVEY